MGSGQHVGAISDALVEDDAQQVARVHHAALKKLMKPAERGARKGVDMGDGDRCPHDAEHPDEPRHGRMYVHGQRQYCPVQAHDIDGSAGASAWNPLFMPESIAKAG